MQIILTMPVIDVQTLSREEYLLKMYALKSMCIVYTKTVQYEV